MHSQLDEQDLALLHALQIAPRISWAEAARVLGSSAGTLAARWERLRAAGLAWVTVHPGRAPRAGTVAFVEVDVDPERRGEVIAALCRDPRAVSVEEAARRRDLFVTTMVPGLSELTRFCLDELPRIPGVRRVGTQLATKIHWEGSRWRLDALDRGQQAALQAARPATAEAPAALPPRHRPLVEALTWDGRRSAADLARVTGRNPATVRRQVARLLASDLLAFRCEIAQLRTRWPLVCTWYAAVPPEELDRTVRSLVTLPELRLCASVSGETNLLFTLWASSAGDLLRLEHLLSEKLPELRLVESIPVLRAPKRMGWLLGPEGRSTGELVFPAPAYP